MTINHIRTDIDELCRSGSRRVGSPGHETALEYLTQTFEKLELATYRGDDFKLPYSVDGIEGCNIVGQVAGTDPEKRPVLIGAHYDTCGDQPGADDNAAAVAVLLNVAQKLKAAQRERTVVLALFDAEEPPYFLSQAMGSIRFFDDQLETPPHCAIVMDLVGHDVPITGLGDLLFITGMESNLGLEATIRGTPAEGVRIVPTLNSYVGDMSDHHIFRINRLPYLLLTCGRWQHYHADSDTPDRLNYNKITSVSRYLSGLIEAVSNADLDHQFEGYDSTRTELHFLKQTIIPVIKNMGLDIDVTNRADIDRIVGLMTQQFDL